MSAQHPDFSSRGQRSTSIGNPALDPERSTSFTAGVIFEPTRNINLTVDFWRIKVKDLIGPPGGQGAAIAQYYTNNGVVTQPGFVARPGTPDPAFPNALPHIGFLESSFVNQDQQVVSGLDFGANFRMPIGNNITWRSSAEASYLMKYQVTRDTGDVENYEGTLSPCNVTSCSGAPQWRALWQNTIEVCEKFTASLTAYYTEGYTTESVDFGAEQGNCEDGVNFGSTQTYYDGTVVACKSPNVWNADLTMNYEVNDNLNVFVNVLNVFDIDAPFDPAAAYHIFGFNPAWSGPNILGRYFRLGAKIDF